MQRWRGTLELTYRFDSLFFLFFLIPSIPLSLLVFFRSILIPNSTSFFTMAQQNGSSGNDFLVKAGLAQMLKGGVIMDVVNAEQVGLQ